MEENKLVYKDSEGFFNIQDENRMAIVMTAPFNIWIVCKAVDMPFANDDKTKAFAGNRFRLLNKIIDSAQLHKDEFTELISKYNDYERELRAGIDRRFMSDIEAVKLEYKLQGKFAEFYYNCWDSIFCQHDDITNDIREFTQPTLLIQILRELERV